LKEEKKGKGVGEKAEEGWRIWKKIFIDER